MKFVTISELRAHAPRIITELEKTGEEVVITKMGKPTALIRLIEEREFQLIPKTKEKGGKKHGKSKRHV